MIDYALLLIRLLFVALLYLFYASMFFAFVGLYHAWLAVRRKLARRSA